MSDEIAIRVNNVSKDFKLPHEKVNSVKSLFINSLKRIHHKRNYETQHALKDISLEIKKGEFFGIVGRNGSGKSTLLKILAGIYQPTHGNIEVSGKLVPFIELGVGFSPELSGRDNVYLNGALLGFSEKEIDEQYNDIVKFAELERFMDQKLKNYSSGMQVRLAFSMAVRAKADILLIDEVLAVGDADFQRKCFDYFRLLKKEHITVVFVSHDMNAVREYCDRAMLIESNKISGIGDTYKIADKYSELFLTHKLKDNENNFNDKKRAGIGIVKIEKASTDKIVYGPKDKELQMYINLKAYGPSDSLMVGFAVKDSLGQFINSSHSWEKTEELIKLDKGKKCKILCTTPNIYEEGTYTVDMYVQGKDVLYDRIEDAISFQVKRSAKSGALVHVESQVRVVGAKSDKDPTNS